MDAMKGITNFVVSEFCEWAESLAAALGHILNRYVKFKTLHRNATKEQFSSDHSLFFIRISSHRMRYDINTTSKQCDASSKHSITMRHKRSLPPLASSHPATEKSTSKDKLTDDLICCVLSLMPLFIPITILWYQPHLNFCCTRTVNTHLIDWKFLKNYFQFRK